MGQEEAGQIVFPVSFFVCSDLSIWSDTGSPRDAGVPIQSEVSLLRLTSLGMPSQASLEMCLLGHLESN